jgi:hypothetical protein
MFFVFSSYSASFFFESADSETYLFYQTIVGLLENLISDAFFDLFPPNLTKDTSSNDYYKYCLLPGELFFCH